MRCSIVLALAWVVATSRSAAQDDFRQFASVVEQLRTARASVSQSRFLLPDQLKVDYDYVLAAVSGMAEQFASGDDEVKSALEAVRSKKDSIEAHVRLVLAIAKKGGVRAAEGLAAVVPERFAFSGEPAGALARGIAAGLEGLPPDVRRPLWQVVLQTAYRGLMGKPDDAEAVQLLMRAIDERATPAEDAGVVSELVKVHPKVPRFCLWEACHEAGLFVGDRSPALVPLFYPDASPRDYPKALDYAKVALKGLGSDRIASAVLEWILVQMAFEQMNRFSLTWREKERVVLPILDRLDALAAKKPLALAGVARVLALKDFNNGPATLAAIEKLPREARTPFIEQVATRMKALAKEQTVEGAPGAIFRRGGYTERSQAMRVAVLPPWTLQVWIKFDGESYVSVTLQVHVYSKTGDELVGVPAVAVERPPSPVRDDKDHERFDLHVSNLPDPAKIGSIEVSTSSETLHSGE